MRISHYEDDDIYFHHAKNEESASVSVPIKISNTYSLWGFINGSCRYIIEGNEYILEPGCILLIRPSETHRVHIDNDCMYERVIVNFTADIIKSIDPNLLLLQAYDERSLGNLNMYRPGEFSINPIKYIKSMCSLDISNDERRLVVIANLITLLNETRAIFGKRSNKYYIANNDIDYNIIQYINSNLFNPLSLDIISERFFISKTHLERKFKLLTGTSVFEYITLKRLAEAQQLLLKGEKATHVSKICGYNEYSTFYRAYKKNFGVPPSDKVKLNNE